MTGGEEPQFGIPAAGRVYVERPGVYAVIVDDGHVLVVETPVGLYLPGGGMDSEETAEQALQREVMEETGCRLTILAELGRARQLVGSGINKVETFFVCALDGAVGGGDEDDHRPRWATIEDALSGLVEEAQRWAVRRSVATTDG